MAAVLMLNANALKTTNDNWSQYWTVKVLDRIMQNIKVKQNNSELVNALAAHRLRLKLIMCMI